MNSQQFRREMLKKIRFYGTDSKIASHCYNAIEMRKGLDDPRATEDMKKHLSANLARTETVVRNLDFAS